MSSAIIYELLKATDLPRDVAEYLIAPYLMISEEAVDLDHLWVLNEFNAMYSLGACLTNQQRDYMRWRLATGPKVQRPALGYPTVADRRADGTAYLIGRQAVTDNSTYGTGCLLQTETEYHCVMRARMPIRYPVWEW